MIRAQPFSRCHFQLLCHGMKEYEYYIYFPFLAVTDIRILWLWLMHKEQGWDEVWRLALKSKIIWTLNRRRKKKRLYYKQPMPNKLWRIYLEMLLKFSSNLYLLMCLVFTVAKDRSRKANTPCGVCVWGQGERLTDEVHGPKRKSPLSCLRPWEGQSSWAWYLSPLSVGLGLAGSTQQQVTFWNLA